MSDELENEEGVEEATETETGEQSTGSNQTKKQETFTQEQVNKIVAKEKAAWKRSHDKEKDALSGAEAELREQISARDEVISKQVAYLMQDLELDEITKELLADKDPLEQFNVLAKIVEKRGKMEIPRTPLGQKKAKEFKSTFTANI